MGEDASGAGESGEGPIQKTLFAGGSSEEGFENPDWLWEQYHGESKTQKELAEQCGVSITSIRSRMIEYGIPRRQNRPKYPSAYTNRSGHRELRAKHHGDRWALMIHRLHATLLVDELSELGGKIVHHKNNCPFDNRLENYEITSKKEHRNKHNTIVNDSKSKGLCRSCGYAQYFYKNDVANFCPKCGDRYDEAEVSISSSIDWKIKH